MKLLHTLPLALLALLLSTSVSHALSVTYAGDSLHGAVGTLDVEGPIGSGAGTFEVTWSIDLDGFEGTATDHPQLTDIGFKAFAQVSSVRVDELMWSNGTTGTLFESGNISNAGCTGPSPAGFVCMTGFDPVIDATLGGTFSARFTVEGRLADDEWSFRGKFGPQNGWVISETAAAPIPEPSAAILFALGAVVAGVYTTHRRVAS